jgi:hypothetical protein
VGLSGNILIPPQPLKDKLTLFACFVEEIIIRNIGKRGGRQAPGLDNPQLINTRSYG